MDRPYFGAGKGTIVNTHLINRPQETGQIITAPHTDQWDSGKGKARVVRRRSRVGHPIAVKHHGATGLGHRYVMPVCARHDAICHWHLVVEQFIEHQVPIVANGKAVSSRAETEDGSAPTRVVTDY